MNRLGVAANVLSRYMPEPYASLTNGMIFGIPLSQTGTLTLDIRKAGLMHLVVLSGMNITLIYETTRTATTSFSRWTSSLISMLIILLFSYLVGFEAPITRALVSAILTNVCVLCGRKPRPLLILIWTGIVCLSAVPDWETSISFHLSYAATLGILLFSPKGSQDQPREGAGHYIYTYIVNDLRMSLGALTLTAPIIWLYFRQVSVISPISNLLVGWTILPLTILGTLASILGLIYPPLGLPFAYASYALVWYVHTVIYWAARFPFAYFSL